MASNVCSLETTQAHPSLCLKGACTEPAHGRGCHLPITSLTPVLARKSHLQRRKTKQNKTNHLQVLHVGDATERLPRDPQDLVFAQISKQEEKRHTALRTKARLYLHLIMTTKPLAGCL